MEEFQQNAVDETSKPAKVLTKDEIKLLIEKNNQINRGIKEISEKVKVNLKQYKLEISNININVL